jgi:hypothetical protein
MKWVLFAAFFAMAPAPVIVFESFMTGPVIFVAANVISLIRDALGPAGAAGVEIVGFFLVHLAIYLFLYGLAASAAAKGLSLIGNAAMRGAACAALVALIGLVGILPLYGGAGIHRGAWGSIVFFFRVLDRSHFGPDAAVTIYGPAVLAFGALSGIVWWARRQSARGRSP